MAINQSRSLGLEKGLLVDTNLMILYAIGSFDLEQITQFKRTNMFTELDYFVLGRFMKGYEILYTTPHILAEVSNLTEKISSHLKQGFFDQFKTIIQSLDEKYDASTELVKILKFHKFGLTDSAIIKMAEQGAMVLTIDLNLYGYISGRGYKAKNFNHIRI
jgi:hypothetical protein